MSDPFQRAPTPQYYYDPYSQHYAPLPAHAPSYYASPYEGTPSPYAALAALSSAEGFGTVLTLLIGVAITLAAIIYGPGIMQNVPKASVSLVLGLGKNCS